MLASLAATPELELDQQEAAALASGIEAVQRCYTRKILPPEAAAWIQLTLAAAGIYGPRYIAIRARRRAAVAKPVSVIRPSYHAADEPNQNTPTQ